MELDESRFERKELINSNCINYSKGLRFLRVNSIISTSQGMSLFLSIKKSTCSFLSYFSITQ